VPRRLAPALACSVCLTGLTALTCFSGQALEGEPCRIDADCGPDLACSLSGLCGEFVCDEPQVVALENFDPDVFLLIDYAQTMDKAALDGRVRWVVVRELAQRLTDELGDRVNFGLQVVPSVDPDLDTSPDPCFTTGKNLIVPGAGQALEVFGALGMTTAKTGEHALSRGLDLALDALATRPGAGLRPQVVVLVSDGPFNCSRTAGDLVTSIKQFDADLAGSVAAALADRAIPTYVVGVGVPVTDVGAPPAPGVEIDDLNNHLAFNQLADAGGRARPGTTRYYTPADIDALVADLRATPPAFEDCRIALAHAPDYPARLAVTLAGNTFHETPDCADDRGWRYADPAHARIELCPATCDEFRARRDLTVDHRCPSE
jgi:hypothetical protein